MSHTFVARRTNFIHDGDYTGTVEIIAHGSVGTGFLLPIEDLFEFVGSMVVHKKIAALDNAEWPEILGVE
jgi:hypothetical protein